MEALLITEDGRSFPCRSFTGSGEVTAEVVFNTGMTGYQEVLTDPSYKGQMVVMTYPLIGNYGTNSEDVESDRIQVSAFILREYQDYPSNFRSNASLAHYLKSGKVMGVDQVDTRAVTRHIRDSGAMRAVISTKSLDPKTIRQKALAAPAMAGQNLAAVVSTNTPYRWVSGKRQFLDPNTEVAGSSMWRNNDAPKVAAFDFGIKYNILRQLEAQGLEVIVVPADTTARTIRQMAPDGIFLSNGPGDPEPVTDAVAAIRELIDYRPLFGICLGHQLLGLALGGKTFKLKFGHRGANQPVKDLRSGRIEITSQNHGFGVDLESMDTDAVEITHMNLNDGTLEGFRHKKLPILAVQYHPEASPGPHDAEYLFHQFKEMVVKEKRASV